MRIAIIGLGVQGRKRRAIAGKKVVALVDPVAAEVDFKTIEELPLDSYDAACVCVPDQEKLAILRHLLRHGKHALVEKPLLAPPDEIQELIDLAKASGAACYTAYNHRFEPHIARLRELLSAGTLGEIYFAKFFYGNGTARDVRNSPWRDKSLGVFSDLGSHMLDMAHFLFGPHSDPGELWSADRFENRAPDHVLFGYRGKRVLEMEATLLSWRNTFHLDLFGELGSAHINCLCKWGPSILTVRTRVLPSGRPAETVEVLEQPDPTWQLEYAHFLELCGTGGTNFENDIWIYERIRELGALIEHVHP
jgi:scyllo-inositol 2-dehydrogenase (NADP+)